MGIRARLRRWIGGPAPAVLDPERPDLVVVACTYDDTEACSVTLARAAATAPAWIADAPAVLRHYLELPAGQVDAVAAIAAQDGYALDVRDAAAGRVRLYRVQMLDALHCAQERSRMAGLAQRHDGTATGWDALQPG